jgi:hypothetical protein
VRARTLAHTHAYYAQAYVGGTCVHRVTIYSYKKDFFLSAVASNTSWPQSKPQWQSVRYAYCRVCATNVRATSNIVGMLRGLVIHRRSITDHRPATSFSSSHSPTATLHTDTDRQFDRTIWHACATAHRTHLCAVVGLRAIPLARTHCGLIDLLNLVAYKKCIMHVHQRAVYGDIRSFQMAGV